MASIINNNDSHDEGIRNHIESYEKRRIVVQDADGNEKILPIGFRFQPTDKELVQHYLVPKAQNKRLPNCYVKDIPDPFLHPRVLIPGGGSENSKYFFSKESKFYHDNYQTGPRRSGWYNQKKKDKDGDDKGDNEVMAPGQAREETIATRKCYKFFEQEDSNQSELRFSGWKMHIYILTQGMHREEDWVACHVYRQEVKCAPPGEGQVMMMN